MSEEKDKTLIQHFIGVLCIALLLLLPTGPLIQLIAGDWILKIYVQFLLPPLAIFGYILYLCYLDEKDKSKN